jgi:23S rRNA (guanosine2251-2'-O)-methyltransferase
MADYEIYGIHAVLASLENSKRTVNKLYINQDRSDDRMQMLITLAEKRGVPIEKLTLQALNRRFGEVAHQGVVARIEKLPEYSESDLQALLAACQSKALILILDGVTDPHNLGACLRTADATGVDFVLIPKDKSSSITPVVSKVACGAAESVPVIRVTNLARAITLLKDQGVWVYGAAGEAEMSIYDVDATGSIALVMGAEGSGLRRLTRELCDGLFSLPMHGSVSSLNVSVATGVGLYEVVRQRNVSNI